MARRVLSWLVSVAAVLAFGAAAPADAEVALSPGCATLNESWADGQYIAAVTNNAFSANERVTVVAGPPASGEVTGVQLEVPAEVIVDTDGFPGTLSYTFPADTETTVRWSATPQSVGLTWDVSCTAATVATTLEADPALLRLLPPRVSAGHVSARLTTSSDPAAPVVGQPVVFRSGGTTLCTGVTGADGRAACTITVAGSLAVIANNGFTATFSGSDGFLPSTDTAPLIA